jgi:hypothetical protein
MRYISVFLILCSAAIADIGCLIGGTSAASSSAGWFNAGLVSAADCHDGNGVALVNAGGLMNIDDDGSGNVRITAGSDQFSNAIGKEGVYARVDFDSVYTDGIYEVLDVPAGGVQVIIDTSWISNLTDSTTSVDIGGAVPFTTAGLEAVYDDAISTADTKNVYLYATGDYTATAQMLIDANNSTAPYVRWLIGCDSSYAKLTTGSYVTMTGPTATMAGTPVIKVVNMAGLGFENIHCTIDGAADSGEDGFQIANTSSLYGYYFINCKASTCFVGFNCNAGTGNRVHDVSFIDCVSVDNVSTSIVMSGLAYRFDHLFSKSAAIYNIYSPTYSVILTNSILVGGNSGVYYNGNSYFSPSMISNCSFYNQTVACIDSNATRKNQIVLYNNLFWVETIGADFPVLTTADVFELIYEDYNFTNADATRAAMLTGPNSQNALWSDTETNLWADAANDDFTVVDAAMIDGGKPTLSDEGGTPADGYSTPGAAQLAQTQAGGGGGGGHIIGGGVVR